MAEHGRIQNDEIKKKKKKFRWLGVYLDSSLTLK